MALKSKGNTYPRPISRLVGLCRLRGKAPLTHVFKEPVLYGMLFDRENDDIRLRPDGRKVRVEGQGRFSALVALRNPGTEGIH